MFNQKHHSLLHQLQLKAESQPQLRPESLLQQQRTELQVNKYYFQQWCYHCRAILDSRSQSNLITENLAQLRISHTDLKQGEHHHQVTNEPLHH
jgi:hypothetical protein